MAGDNYNNADAGTRNTGASQGLTLEQIVVTGVAPLEDRLSAKLAATERNLEGIGPSLPVQAAALNALLVGAKFENSFQATGRGAVGHLTGPPSAFGLSYGEGLYKGLAVIGTPGAAGSAGTGGQHFVIAPAGAGSGAAIGYDAPIASYTFNGLNRWKLTASLRYEPPVAGTKGFFYGVVGTGLTFAAANGGLGTTFGIGVLPGIGWVSDATSTGSTFIHRYQSVGGVPVFTPTLLPQFSSLTYGLEISGATYRQWIVDNTSDALVDDTGFVPLPPAYFLGGVDYKPYAWVKDTAAGGATLNVQYLSATYNF